MGNYIQHLQIAHPKLYESFNTYAKNPIDMQFLNEWAGKLIRCIELGYPEQLITHIFEDIEFIDYILNTDCRYLITETLLDNLPSLVGKQCLNIIKWTMYMPREMEHFVYNVLKDHEVSKLAVEYLHLFSEDDYNNFVHYCNQYNTSNCKLVWVKPPYNLYLAYMGYFKFKGLDYTVLEHYLPNLRLESLHLIVKIAESHIDYLNCILDIYINHPRVTSIEASAIICMYNVPVSQDYDSNSIANADEIELSIWEVLHTISGITLGLRDLRGWIDSILFGLTYQEQKQAKQEILIGLLSLGEQFVTYGGLNLSPHEMRTLLGHSINTKTANYVCQQYQLISIHFNNLSSVKDVLSGVDN